MIQLTDDEKFYFKQDLKLEQVHGYSFENARDIIACGFKPDKTFIFSDLDYMGCVSRHQGGADRAAVPFTGTSAGSRAAFRTTSPRPRLASRTGASRGCRPANGRSDNIGKNHFCSIQAAPSFSNSFPHIFGTASHIPCLIPCAIDQVRPRPHNRWLIAAGPVLPPDTRCRRAA